MRILIAEDDPVSRRILEVALCQFGHDVVAVDNGRLAMERLCQPDAPRLAILDWMMPEMDGVEVCRHIRRISDEAPPYLLILTAKDDAESIVEGLDAGANDYLTKPYHREELRARLGVGQRMLEMQSALSAKIRELGEALDHIKTLRGIVPICASCKKIRDDRGFWNQVEAYVQAHSEAKFTHSICPDCMKSLYPEYYRKMTQSKAEESPRDHL